MLFGASKQARELVDLATIGDQEIANDQVLYVVKRSGACARCSAAAGAAGAGAGAGAGVAVADADAVSWFTLTNINISLLSGCSDAVGRER